MEYRLLDDDGEYVTIDLALAKAAPDLLAACKAMVELVDHPPPPSVPGAVQVWRGAVVRLIAKAEGG